MHLEELRSNPSPGSGMLFCQLNDSASRSAVLPQSPRLQAVSAFPPSLRAISPGTVSLGEVVGKAEDGRSLQGLQVVFPDESRLELSWWRNHDPRSGSRRITITSKTSVLQVPDRHATVLLDVAESPYFETVTFATPRVLDRAFAQFADRALAVQHDALSAERALLRELSKMKSFSDLLSSSVPPKPLCFVSTWNEGRCSTYHAELCMPDGSSLIVEGPLHRLAGPTLFRVMNCDGFVREANLVLLSTARTGRKVLRGIVETVESCSDAEEALGAIRRSYDQRSLFSKCSNCCAQFFTAAFGMQKVPVQRIFDRRFIDDGVFHRVT